MNRKQRNARKVKAKQTRLMNKVDKLLGMPKTKTIRRVNPITGKRYTETVIVTKHVDKSKKLKPSKAKHKNLIVNYRKNHTTAITKG